VQLRDDFPVDVLENCIISYFLESGKSAENFFISQLHNEEYKLYAALFLAQLGEHKQTFPIFAAALERYDEYEIHIAILGLATIGTEEALQLILNLSHEKNSYSPKEARWNFDYINFEERR